jgi:hypothetical protein|tara:strand:- start:1109 stop:1318 length:210 start_codon:yes stop_codon:yes gene_type:complete
MPMTRQERALLHRKQDRIIKADDLPISKLTDSTVGTVNGNILDTTVDNTTTDDLSTLVAKINEIIEKIN